MKFAHYQKPKLFASEAPYSPNSLCRSLAKSHEDADNVTIDNEKIAIYVERINNVTTSEDIALPWSESVMLEDELRSFYDVWSCSEEEDEICNGLYVAATSVSVLRYFS